MIRELEILSLLPPALKKDIENYCRIRKILYAEIINTNPLNIWEMGKVNGLIAHLSANYHSMKWISLASQQPADYCVRVIEQARRDQTRIRTTNWERIASCRR